MPRSLLTSSAAGRPTLLTPASPSAIAEARKLIETDIGLDILEQALVLACGTEDPDDPPSKYRRLLDLMQDKVAFNGHTITTLMREAGVNLFDVLIVVSKRNMAFALAKSSQRMERIMEDIAIDAQSKIVKCRNCFDGYIPNLLDPSADPLKCADCNGDGVLRQIGDLDSRKLYFAAHGIGPKGGSQQVINIQQGTKVEMGKDKSSEPSILTRVQKIMDGEE